MYLSMRRHVLSIREWCLNLFFYWLVRTGHMNIPLNWKEWRECAPWKLCLQIEWDIRLACFTAIVQFRVCYELHCSGSGSIGMYWLWVFLLCSHCFPPAQRAVPGPAAAQAISYPLPLNTMMRTTKPMGWASIAAVYPMESSKLMSQHLCEKNQDFLKRNGKRLLVCVLSYFLTNWF